MFFFCYGLCYWLKHVLAARNPGSHGTGASIHALDLVATLGLHVLAVAAAEAGRTAAVSLDVLLYGDALAAVQTFANVDRVVGRLVSAPLTSEVLRAVARHPLLRPDARSFMSAKQKKKK